MVIVTFPLCKVIILHPKQKFDERDMEHEENITLSPKYSVYISNSFTFCNFACQSTKHQKNTTHHINLHKNFNLQSLIEIK